MIQPNPIGESNLRNILIPAARLSSIAEVNLSDDVYERVQSRVEVSDFDSSDEYIEYITKTVLDRIEGIDDEDTTDRGEVMHNLRDLGYLS